MGLNKVSEETFAKFKLNSRLVLSDLTKCRKADGLYISQMTAVSLEEYVANRNEYCKKHHEDTCTECASLISLASYILQEGIAKVSDVYKRQFPSCNYKSDKAVRRLMQLPVVIFKQEFLFVMEYIPTIDYMEMMAWITKMLPGKAVETKLNKQTLRSLCELASTESDRKLIRCVATWDMSAKQARKTYAIDDNASKLNRVKQAMAMAKDIQMSVLQLAQLEDIALLKSLGVLDDFSSESDTDSSGDESENLESDSDCVVDSCESGNETHVVAPINNCEIASECDIHLPLPSSNPDQLTFNQDLYSEDVAATNPVQRNETLLSWLRETKLNWFSFFDDLQHEETLNKVVMDVTEYLSHSDLSDEELQCVEMSRQAFIEFKQQQPLVIEDEEVFSESDPENEGTVMQEIHSLTSESGKQSIRAARRAIRQRAKRTSAKQIASQSILKRKISKRASRIQGWKKYFIFWDRNEKWKIFCKLSTQILYNLN